MKFGKRFATPAPKPKCKMGFRMFSGPHYYTFLMDDHKNYGIEKYFGLTNDICSSELKDVL